MLSGLSQADMFKAEGLLVNVQPGHDRYHWKLIYGGELSSHGSKMVNRVGCVVDFPK